ncbi:unnamed protein product [Mytilus coruscus]|uniref:Uncharacterized protein n=1 Tax=Mytilus coruscus TaxID=42192 RepID=A0A6J8EQB5_MYTCO|nr:unnamed protein product [Mytilus coruscus]
MTRKIFYRETVKEEEKPKDQKNTRKTVKEEEKPKVQQNTRETVKEKEKPKVQQNTRLDISIWNTKFPLDVIILVHLLLNGFYFYEADEFYIDKIPICLLSDEHGYRLNIDDQKNILQRNCKRRRKPKDQKNTRETVKEKEKPKVQQNTREAVKEEEKPQVQQNTRETVKEEEKPKDQKNTRETVKEDEKLKDQKNTRETRSAKQYRYRCDNCRYVCAICICRVIFLRPNIDAKDSKKIEISTLKTFIDMGDMICLLKGGHLFILDNKLKA